LPIGNITRNRSQRPRLIGRIVGAMVAPSGHNSSAFPNSPYAAELERGAASHRFSPMFEAQYIRARLAGNRTLIRVACAFAVLLPAARGTEHTLGGSWDQAYPIPVTLVLTASIALAAIAWSRSFDRFYLPVAQILIPIRNSIAAAIVAGAAAHGQLELLMVLPLMVLGPFFFLGLSFRAALVSVVLTVASFIVSAAVFELALPVALRTCVFLLIGTVTCAIAARHVEKSSRTSFLESHLIAELAEHDALTGLKNRRVFDEQLERLWQQAVEDVRTVAILLLDVDHFKTYNDVYGHQAGDHALRLVAQTLQTFVSGTQDVLARYGGEEFAVILYDIDGPRAEALADRMRRAVSELAIQHYGSPAAAVTISAGVAVIEPSRERRARGALQLADQALYEAKMRGRNRVELMDEAAHGLLVTGVFSKASLNRDAAAR
jgi:diguanylate cyclase (GGDEF)-like protein